MALPRVGTMGVLVIVAVTGTLLNRYRRWRVDFAWRAGRRYRADGVLEGAEPIELTGDPDHAVLLLHGSGDTPQSMRALAQALHDRGYTVRVALFPGHGRSPTALSSASADAYLKAAKAELEALASRSRWVAIVGQSMGGAVAVRLVAGRPDVPALVLLAPYLTVAPLVRRITSWAWLWGLTMPFLPSGGERSILDDAERRRALSYGLVTPRAMRALVRTSDAAAAALPQVRTPTLVLQSRHDNRLTAEGAQASFAKLGAPDKRLELLDEGGHVISVDHGRERVFEMTAAWLAAHGGIPLRK